MNKEEVRQKLIKLVIKTNKKELKETDFKKGVKLIDDLEFDSISIIQLIVDIEEEFHIEFDDDEVLIDKIDVFDELVNYVYDLVREEHGE